MKTIHSATIWLALLAAFNTGCVSPGLREYRDRAATLAPRATRAEVHRLFPPLISPEPEFVWSISGVVTGNETYPIDSETELSASVWYRSIPPTNPQSWTPPQRGNDVFSGIEITLRRP